MILHKKECDISLSETDVKYVSLFLNERYSNYVSDHMLIKNEYLTCTWLNAIDMEIKVGDDGPISICSQLYKSLHMTEALEMYKLFPPKKLVKYHFSSKNRYDRNKPLIWGDSKTCFISYEDYERQYIEKLLSLFYQKMGIILPKKYLHCFEQGFHVLHDSYSAPDCLGWTLFAILQSLFKDDIRLLEDSKERLTVLIYENQVYDIISNADIVIKRRCSDERSISIFKTCNNREGKRMVADYLFVYTYLITTDSWLEKYSKNNGWKRISIDKLK